MTQETRTKPHGVESARRCNAPWNKAGQMPKQIETQIWKSFWSQRRGYGPEPHQVLRQMMDKLAESDSRWAEVPQDEKTLIGLCNVYRFYVSTADFERASKTARLIQKAYHHADRRFNMIVKATDHQDVISETIVLLERYAGIEDVTELKLSRIENGSVLVDFEFKDGRPQTRILRSPKVIGAYVLGVPVDAFESELKLAAQ
ncbi:hypothetical protein CN155_08155 [Sinorhizobium meliloti]|uniref:hypothetical protein n=1 Tax=Rhizobium meliloti TaxID=382 RepID=UPI000FDB1DEF|nr:hypothetical protein [Sinorhizobium meliloti]RVK59242.1 hypothetical protein CN155_08155 [Sinorhizobium meliloti]